MSDRRDLPLQDRFLEIVKNPQFYWWCGHVCFVLNAILYITSVLSLHSFPGFYRRAYAGALVSYGIVIWRSLGVPRTFNLDFINDENVQYFALAFYWYSYRPITVTLLPFFIFSFFHAIAYIPSSLIPALFPDSENSMIVQTCQSMKRYTDTHHELAMQLAAYIEVVGVMGRLIVGVVSFQTSVLALIIFAHFLRLRYFFSNYTREALHEATAWLDQLFLPLAADQRQAAQLASKLYTNTKGIVIRYGSTSIQHDSSSRSNSTTATAAARNESS